jgi:hypothetical protein
MSVPDAYLVFGVLWGRGFGPDGAGCGQSTGIVFGWGRSIVGFGVFGKLSGMSTGRFDPIVFTVLS